jgi:hypothetical protein
LPCSISDFIDTKSTHFRFLTPGTSAPLALLSSFFVQELLPSRKHRRTIYFRTHDTEQLKIDSNKLLISDLCQKCCDVIVYEPKGLLSADGVRVPELCGRFAWDDFIQTKDTCPLCHEIYEAYPQSIDESNAWSYIKYAVVDDDLADLVVKKDVAGSGVQLLRLQQSSIETDLDSTNDYNFRDLLMKTVSRVGTSYGQNR